MTRAKTTRSRSCFGDLKLVSFYRDFADSSDRSREPENALSSAPFCQRPVISVSSISNSSLLPLSRASPHDSHPSCRKRFLISRTAGGQSKVGEVMPTGNFSPVGPARDLQIRLPPEPAGPPHRNHRWVTTPQQVNAAAISPSELTQRKLTPLNFKHPKAPRGNTARRTGSVSCCERTPDSAALHSAALHLWPCICGLDRTE